MLPDLPSTCYIPVSEDSEVSHYNTWLVFKNIFPNFLLKYGGRGVFTIFYYCFNFITKHF